jgi:thioredoxin reductase
MAEPYDILVAGGGLAGTTAAIYAARSGLRTLLIDIPGAEPGTGVESIWPGDVHIAEADLIQRLREHAHQVGAEQVQAEIGALDLAARTRAVVTGAGVRYEARAVILCSRSLPLGQAPEILADEAGYIVTVNRGGVFAAGEARRLPFPEAITLAADGAAAALAAVRFLAEEEYLHRELVEPAEPVLAVF